MKPFEMVISGSFAVTNSSAGFDMRHNSIVNSPNERSRRDGIERSALLRSDSNPFRAIFTGIGWL